MLTVTQLAKKYQISRTTILYYEREGLLNPNRLYPNKTFGCIVDYFGVFDDAAQALEFDEQSMQQVITNLSDLRERLPQAMKDALKHFAGVDRSIKGFEGLEAAQDAINTDEKKDAFAKDFKFLKAGFEVSYKFLYMGA